MPVELVAEATITVGQPVTVEGASPTQPFAVVFEDDARTGYLYALELEKADNPIVDAVQIYNVENVTDREKPSVVRIVWSTDGSKAALLINRHPHAVFDFTARRSYCRTGFPPADRRWTQFTHDWSDDALDLFR